MIHNEDSRVKVPALLHFTRLGYKYQTKKNVNIDRMNNIYVEILKESLERINNREVENSEIELLLKEIDTLTDNQKDKGRDFYERLIARTGLILIDFENPLNNDFRVVSELTFKREHEEFRPDITTLVNGIPLGFLEVKRPNNHRGVQNEFDRMKYRSSKEEFVPYLNQMQV